MDPHTNECCVAYNLLKLTRHLYQWTADPAYFDYYERARTHLSLDKDAPISRPVQPPEVGRIVEVSQVGGLHHRYDRIAA